MPLPPTVGPNIITLSFMYGLVAEVILALYSFKIVRNKIIWKREKIITRMTILERKMKTLKVQDDSQARH